MTLNMQTSALMVDMPQTAEMMDLSVRTVAKLVRSGELPSYKIRSARRIAIEDIAAYLDARRVAQ